MNICIRRTGPRDAHSVLGSLYLNGEFFCYTLERADTLIPEGVYVVTMTPSERATIGKLWSPDPDHRLPLLADVVGREGIRIHAANEWDELEGCTAVGFGIDKLNLRLINSRRALSGFIAKLNQALVDGGVTAEYTSTAAVAA